MSALIAFIIPIWALCTWDGDVNWPNWCFLAWGASSFLVVRSKVPALFKITALYILANAAMTYAWRPFTADLPIDQMIVIRLLGATTAFEFLLLFTLFTNYWKEIRYPISLGIYLAGLAHTAMLFFDQAILRIPTGSAEIGLLGNRSIGASFSAVWMFYAFHTIKHQRYKYLALIAVPAILISSSGISFMALVAGTMAMILAINIEQAPFVGCLFFAAAGVAEYVKPEFWNHLSRYDMWTMWFNEWISRKSLLLGDGGGTFKMYGPLAQIKYHFMDGGRTWLIFAHNDWLQVLMESGIVGLALTIASYGLILWKARKRPALFATAISYGIVMLGNYPLRIAILALFAWIIGSEIVFEDESDSQLAK